MFNYPENWLPTLGDTHQYNTRNRNKLTIQQHRVRSSSEGKNCMYIAPKEMADNNGLVYKMSKN